jgi:hypothetical protein
MQQFDRHGAQAMAANRHSPGDATGGHRSVAINGNESGETSCSGEAAGGMPRDRFPAGTISIRSAMTGRRR